MRMDFKVNIDILFQKLNLSFFFFVEKKKKAIVSFGCILLLVSFVYDSTFGV